MGSSSNYILPIGGTVLVIVTLVFNIQGYGMILLVIGSGLLSYSWVSHKNRDSQIGKKLLLTVLLTPVIALIFWIIWWGISSGFKM